MAKKLRDMFVGDTWPPHYFRIYETYETTDGDILTRPANLTTDYDEIKYSARHESNTEDVNDHTKDDIYNDMDIVISGGNTCYYAWGANDLPEEKIGKWEVKVFLKRATTLEQFHLAETFEFVLRNKHRYGLQKSG